LVIYASDSGTLQDHISILYRPSFICTIFSATSPDHATLSCPTFALTLQLLNPPPSIPYNCDLCHNCPPSTGTVAPFTCPLALLAKNTTNPAISSGLPNLPVGFLLANASVPPMASINPFAMRVGKKPGAMELQRMCLGPSSMARWFIRWITAALEAE